MSSSSKPRKSTPRATPSSQQGASAKRGPSAKQGSATPAPRATQAVPAMARPWTVSVTSLIMALEAVVVLYGAMNFALTLSQPGPLSAAGRVFLMVLMVLGAAFAATVAAKHFVGKAWTRAAVVVWQLFQVILSGQFLGGGAPVLGVILLVPAAVALLLVFSPATRRYLETDDRPRG